MVRTSAIVPEIAAAAALAGLARCVRARGPCRPMKLRFEVETERWPGATVSPLAARHIEQPGSRHSKPASTKILSSPSATASRLTFSEPGTIQARTPGATLRPRAPSAPARKSLSRLLVPERLEPQVIERGLQRGPARRIVDISGIGDMTIDTDDMFRADAPGHLRLDFGDIDHDFAVEHNVRIARQLSPSVDRPLPH